MTNLNQSFEKAAVIEPSFTYGLFGHELVIDNFAGGGGASAGMEQALGRPIDLAINHDPIALAVHELNHPESAHSVADVWDVKPSEAVNGQTVGLAWFSPDCRHHSRAKGSRPVSKSVRGLAWVAVRWAAVTKPRCIVIENVPEMEEWGPLVKGPDGKTRPCPDRKGQTFKGFIRALERHGYDIDWKVLQSCDFGAPTIRKRLYIIARRDGRPIKFPKPTHGPAASLLVKQNKLLPYPSAASCIDWSVPGKSIFNRKKSLVPATLERIAKGTARYVVQSETPFILNLQEAAGQLSGITNHPRPENRVLVASFLAKHYTGVVGADLRRPLPTVTATDHNALVSCFMLNMKGINRQARDITDPLSTICAGSTHAYLVGVLLAPYLNHDSAEQSLESGLTTGAPAPLSTVFIDGELYVIFDITMRMLQPHELAAAQGFPTHYRFDGFDGKKISKKKQVRLIGNSVCPPVARAIVESNFGHERKMQATLAA
ncbi:DNA cytosine methyltransferase [Halomonas sp. 86]|uniref:DNA cytosine methyltransferase n=1 Tax=unclassified Halomonas TaxID=2609666 RepID=UPI004033E619